jgi:hypothetical protein
MCRSIKVLRRPETPATPDEISAAALQFVRKVSGFRAPSKSNRAAFDAAVRDIAAITGRLLAHVATGRGATHSVSPGRSGHEESALHSQLAP